jgi:hypothetical protein
VAPWAEIRDVSPSASRSSATDTAAISVRTAFHRFHLGSLPDTRKRLRRLEDWVERLSDGLE